MNFEIGRKVEEDGAFNAWVILELLGHRRITGLMTEVEIAGSKFLRIDIYGEQSGNIPETTQFYAPSSVYAITPTTEEAARRLGNTTNQIAPVQPWELRLPEHEDTPY